MWLTPAHLSGFQVYQPSHRTVNPDGSATITCEHNEISSSTRDIRLNDVDDVIPYVYPDVIPFCVRRWNAGVCNTHNQETFDTFPLYEHFYIYL